MPETRTATGQLKEQAGVVGQDVRELGRITKEVVGETYEAGRQKAKDWEKSLESQIQHNPMKSVLIAAGVGLVLGVLIGRR